MQSQRQLSRLKYTLVVLFQASAFGRFHMGKYIGDNSPTVLTDLRHDAATDVDSS